MFGKLQLSLRPYNMQNNLILTVIFLIAFVVAVRSAAVNAQPDGIDFYKLYNNPEAHVNIRDRRTTVS